MSWLCDDAELISGAWLTSAYAGHGVLAEDIPSTGVHGASMLYDQISLPGDAGKEVRGLILTQPSGLTSWAHGEDGAITAEGADGVYTYTAQVYVDGVALGSPVTVTLTFGAGSVSASLAGGSGSLSIGASAVPVVSIAITGGTGALSVQAESLAEAVAALVGESGSLSAAASGAALAVVALAGDSGTLSAAAAGDIDTELSADWTYAVPGFGLAYAVPAFGKPYAVPGFGKTYTAH